MRNIFRYIEWFSHEPEPGDYHFDGDNDLVHFIELAQANDLLVILRPGPFIDAERDFVSTFMLKFLIRRIIFMFA